MKASEIIEQAIQNLKSGIERWTIVALLESAKTENKTQIEEIERLKAGCKEFSEEILTKVKVNVKLHDRIWGLTEQTDAQKKEIEYYKACKEGADVRVADLQVEINRLAAFWGGMIK